MMSILRPSPTSESANSDGRRVVAYIDGFNLSSAMKEAGLLRYMWLDIVGLVNELLQRHQRLVSVHFFTAPLEGNGRARRHSDFLVANEESPKLTIHKGKFQFNSGYCGICRSPLSCSICGSLNKVPVEKQSDVSLGTQLGLDAGRDRFDTALIVSTDSDFVGAIRLVRETFPEKRVILALPPGRYERAHDLSESATDTIPIWPDSLKRAQLPDKVRVTDGKMVCRPQVWS